MPPDEDSSVGLTLAEIILYAISPTHYLLVNYFTWFERFVSWPRTAPLELADGHQSHAKQTYISLNIFIQKWNPANEVFSPVLVMTKVTLYNMMRLPE